MDLDDYQEAARRTAIYADNHRVIYPALGLASEAGEVAGPSALGNPNLRCHNAAVASDLLGADMVTAVGRSTLAKQPFGPTRPRADPPRRQGFCDFCREIQGSSQAHFNQIYGPFMTSRIVALSSRFIAVPTIGQTLPRWIMILPVPHYPCFAELPLQMRNEASSLANNLAARIAAGAPYLIFEHGSLTPSRGCGISHAHLHVVPVPSSVALADILSPAHAVASSLLTAWASLHLSSEYLLLRDTEDRIGYIDATSSQAIGSQFMRQQLARLFYYNALHWDWRHFTEPEARFFDAMATLRG